MKLVAQSTDCGSVLKDGKVVGFTHHKLVFEGMPDDLQEVWNFVCRLKQGDAFREPHWMHPETHWTQEAFGFSDKGAAAMVKLAFG